MNAKVKLSPRLTVAADMAGNGVRFADIGTDHAQLPAFLLLAHRFSFALLCDVAQGPLDRAQACVSRLGLADRCTLRLTPGFRGLAAGEFDTAAVCGMGGLTIIEILIEARAILGADKRLILQPQSDILSLRAFLKDSGYTLEVERAVKDGRHCYTVLLVRPPDTCSNAILRPVAVEDYLRFNPAWATDTDICVGKLSPLQHPDDALFLHHCISFYANMAKGALHEENDVLYQALTELLNTFKNAL